MTQFFLPCNRCEHFQGSLWCPITGEPVQNVCVRPNTGSTLNVATGQEEHQIMPPPSWNYCISERGDNFACGPQARYFQSKS